MEQYFTVVLIFRNFIPGNCCSICFPSWNFRNFWLNGKCLICCFAISLLSLSWYSLLPLSYKHGYFIHSAINREISLSSKDRAFLFKLFLASAILGALACSGVKILIDVVVSLRMSARFQKSLSIA